MKTSNFLTKKPFKLSLLAASIVMASATMATPVTTTISGSGPISTPAIHKGDTVNLQITLDTSDPNENGEGEPLVVSSSGGFSTTVSNYAQPLAISFVASVDNETLNGVLSSDGDETGTIIVDVNQKKRFTQDQKDSFARSANELNKQAAAEAVAAALCLAVPDPTITKACAIGAGALSGSTWYLSTLLTDLALDPPDSNYTVIVQPTTPTFTPITVQAGVTQAEADSLNTLLANQAQAIGLARAIVASINKADGAAAAGDSYWESNQMQAAGTYASQLSQLLSAESALRTQIQDSFASAGFSPVTFTANDVLSFESQVAASGLPSYITDTLIQLGADSATIQQITKLAFVQDVNQVAGTFPADLTDSALDDAIQQSVSALTDFAQSNAKPLQPGDLVVGQGTIPRTNSTPLFFEVNAQGIGPNGAVIGHLTLLDQSTGLAIWNGVVTKAAILGNTAIIDGTYHLLNGSNGTFHIVGQSNGGLGQGTVSIVASNGLNVNGAANIEIFEPPTTPIITP